MTDDAGKKWLEDKAKEAGVTRLESGLLYKVVEKGAGSRKPKANEKCDCNYWGKLIDGTEFDSSYKRGKPLTFAPSQVIAGWTEAMQKMVEGDKWELYIPAELGYGRDGTPGGPIPGKAALHFEMKLEKIVG